MPSPCPSRTDGSSWLAGGSWAVEMSRPSQGAHARVVQASNIESFIGGLLYVPERRRSKRDANVFLAGAYGSCAFDAVRPDHVPLPLSTGEEGTEHHSRFIHDGRVHSATSKLALRAQRCPHPEGCGYGACRIFHVLRMATQVGPCVISLSITRRRASSSGIVTRRMTSVPSGLASAWRHRPRARNKRVGETTL